MPETKPQTKPDQVSTELPFTEATVSTMATEVRVSSEIPTTTTTLSQDSTKSSSTVNTRVNEKDLFGPLDDDYEDYAPLTESEKEISTTTVKSSSTEESITESYPEEDTSPSQLPFEQAPDTAAQLGTSTKPATETLPTESSVTEGTQPEGLGSSTFVPLETSSTTTNPAIESTDCIYVEKTYKDKEQIPSDDPCNLCFCTSGEVVCAIKECPVPVGKENCVALPAPIGECCPVEYRCGEFQMFMIFRNSCIYFLTNF